MSQDEASPHPAPRFRPPDALLPSHQQTAARTRAGEQSIFLSWGGAIYGPATAEEVIAGVRTSWFEEDTLFWFDGQEEWRPVTELSGLVDGGHHTLAGRRVGEAPADAPPLPGTRSRVRPIARAHRRNRHKSGSKRRHKRSSRLGRTLIFVFVLLAAAVTVGLLFLLMQM